MFGNVANGLYQTALAIREQEGLDVHLYLDQRDGPTTRPESDDPSLADGYPDWIHVGRYLTLKTVLAPWTSQLVAELSRYDLLLVSGFGPVYAQWTGRPWCFYTTGDDLTVIPFPLRFWRVQPRLRTRLGLLGMGIWQRRGARRATEIWTQRFLPFQAALERLGVDPSRIADLYLPIVFDAERFKRDSGMPSDPDGPAARLRAEGGFVVFHPSRLILDDRPTMRETGQWKGNDKLIRGFAALAARRPDLRPVLAMPDRTESPGVAEAKALIAELGVGDRVRWLIPSDPRGFRRSQLLELYAAADVVPDDFGVGWFGSVVIEALSMELPVLSYLDEEIMLQLYPSHPVVVAREPDEIEAALERLADDPAERKRLGTEGRRWVIEHHSHAALARRFTHEARRVLGTMTQEDDRVGGPPTRATRRRAERASSLSARP